MDISVIIPVYNAEKTIIECVNSVVDSCIITEYQWEIILVNDGSKDNSVNIIDQYRNSSDYKKQITLINQENGGAAKARNAGIRAAKGEFIAFNDSDDRWLIDKINLQMSIIKNGKNINLLSGIFGVDNVTTIKNIGKLTPISIKDQVLKNYFSPQASIVRASILQKTGLFNEQMRHAEEGYFFNNIVYLGGAYLNPNIVTEPISDKERWGDSGLSGNLVAMEKGELFNIKSAYQSKYISLGLFTFAYIFSIAKFFRRILISKYRKLCK